MIKVSVDKRKTRIKTRSRRRRRREEKNGKHCCLEVFAWFNSSSFNLMVSMNEKLLEHIIHKIVVSLIVTTWKLNVRGKTNLKEKGSGVSNFFFTANICEYHAFHSFPVHCWIIVNLKLVMWFHSFAWFLMQILFDKVLVHSHIILVRFRI